MLRRAALATVVVLGTVAGLSGTASAAPGDGPFYSCTNAPGPVYTAVGGSLIWLRSWHSFGYPDSTGHAVTSTTCGSAAHPADGTIAQSMVNGTPHATYEIIGGAPLDVTSWAAIGLTAQPASTAYFDADSLPAAAGPDQTNTGPPWNYNLVGSLDYLARNAYFRSLSGTIYRTDGAGHPSIVSGVPAGRAAPIVDQASINSCERMNCSPWGDITIDVVGRGRVHVSGYALDAMTPKQLTVRLQGAGTTIDVPANQADASINAGYGVSGNHGFDRVLAVPAGHYDLCVTFLGFAPGGTSTPVGCQLIDVPGSKPGRVHRPRVTARGHGTLVVKWRQPATHGTPVTIYVVKTSTGMKKRVVGAKHKIVLKHLVAGRSVSVKVRAINGVGPGRFSAPSKMVRVR